MTVTYELDRESDFIHTRCTGNVTLEEVLRHFQELETEPSLPERLDVLLDLDEMQTLPETNELSSVVSAVQRLEARLKWGACAIVASRDALFGMSRVFEAFAEGRFSSSCVFRRHDKAERWLASVRSPAP